MAHGQRSGPVRADTQGTVSKARALVRQSARALSVICACALVFGTMGAVWPFGDSLSIGRLPTALVLAATSPIHWATRGRIWSAATGVGAIAALVSTWAPAPHPGPSPYVTLYQKNLYFRNAQIAAVAADIGLQDPDILTLQEIRTETHPLLQTLRDSHPHQAWCPFAGVGGTAVLSRWPALSEPRCLRGATALQVASPVGPLWVISVHLSWPAPMGQAAHARRLAQSLANLEGPSVMAGDFNMVAWGHAVGHLRRATETRRHGGPWGTLPIGQIVGLHRPGWPALPIDHIFPPQGWGADLARRPRIGSDHRGLVARMAPRAP